MTVEELVAYLEYETDDPEHDAVLRSVKICLRSPRERAKVAEFAAWVLPMDETSFLLAFGHYLAVAEINVLIEERVLPAECDPAPPTVE